MLINGASGGVGSFAVQIAKAMGAEVTAVCSTRHVERVRSLGADEVIDYTREDFARRTGQFDVMLDLVGNRSLAECKGVLKERGTFVSCAGSPEGMWLGPIAWMVKMKLAGVLARQKVALFLTQPRREDLVALSALVEAGALRPLIERRYPLREAAEAVRHVAEGHAQGKTVITVRGSTIPCRVVSAGGGNNVCEDDRVSCTSAAYRTSSNPRFSPSCPSRTQDVPVGLDGCC